MSAGFIIHWKKKKTSRYKPWKSIQICNHVALRNFCVLHVTQKSRWSYAENAVNQKSQRLLFERGEFKFEGGLP